MGVIQRVVQLRILALSTKLPIFQDAKGNLNCLEQNTGSKYRVLSAIRPDGAKTNMRRMCHYILFRHDNTRCCVLINPTIFHPMQRYHTDKLIITRCQRFAIYWEITNYHRTCDINLSDKTKGG